MILYSGARTAVAERWVPADQEPADEPARHSGALLVGTDRSRWNLSYRPYSRADRTLVFEMLPMIGQLYPGGVGWLNRKLNDVEDGRARCTLVQLGRWPAGLAIETPKGQRHVKLSTLVVPTAFRGKGVGTGLVSWLCAKWLSDDIETTHLTMPLAAANSVKPVFLACGFQDTAVCRDRYGNDRHELVMSWSPQQRTVTNSR